jgi:putative DNA primase/helicase
MSDGQQVFYAAEQHFSYRGGVYVEMSEMEAQRLVQEKNADPGDEDVTDY